jgi:hypothetical protein
MLKLLLNFTALILMLFVSCSVCLAKNIIVTLSFQPEQQNDMQIVIKGKTNLPPEMSLSVILGDALTDEYKGSTNTKVLSDGTFKSDPFGPTSGLDDGEYSISVSTLIASEQPDSVRKIIGDDCQNLKGPLVKKSIVGTTIASERKLIVGGKDAIKNQALRLQRSMVECKELSLQIEKLFSDIEKQLLDDRYSLSNLQKWDVFAHQFQQNYDLLSKRLDNIKSPQGRIYLASFLGGVYSMFKAASSQNDKDYREAKAFYVNNLKELEAFIRKNERKIIKNDAG